MTNLETESQKLLQVVLFGQPELDDKLKQPKLRQLLQRITFSYKLKLMDADQLYQYVRHRMAVAGYRVEGLFDEACCQLLHKASGGTPRIVNVLCHKSLMLAYGEGVQKITLHHVKTAIDDTEAAISIRKNSLWGWLPTSLFIAASVLILVLTNISSNFNLLDLGWIK
jgi:MSHA biogenesis protein MshM